MVSFKRLALVALVGTAVSIATMGAGCFGAEMASQRPAPSATPTSTTGQAPSSSASDAVTGTPVKVLDVGNVYGIKAGAKAPSFTLTKPATLVQLITYHYIAGGGPAPGTIGLRSASGTVVGPFQASGVDAQGGVKNGFWVANTNTHLDPGTYTVVDANPATWSTNSRAKGLGFTTITVIYDK